MRRVLIVGASIAGPALAWWLHRYGFEVTVVERAPALRPGGYKIDIRGVALDVVERMGLKDRLAGLDTDMQFMSFVNSAGRRLVDVRADLFMGRGEADLEVMRGDLSQLLYDETRADVDYRFGQTVTELDPSYDLVIGADGLNSTVRQLAFGGDAVRDLGYAVSIATVPNHLQLDRRELIYSVPGRTVNLYSTARDANAKVLFLFGADQKYPGREQQLEILNTTFRGAGWETDRLLDAVAVSDDFYFDTVSQVQLDRYAVDRVSLVGDAAYCPSFASGQGTSLALVGAYVLAGELSRSEPAQAFTAYEQLMRPYVERNLKLGRDNLGRMISKSPLQSWAGAMILRILPKLPMKDTLVAKMTQPIHDAARAIELPDYR